MREGPMKNRAYITSLLGRENENQVSFYSRYSNVAQSKVTPLMSVVSGLLSNFKKRGSKARYSEELTGGIKPGNWHLKSHWIFY